MSMSTSLDDLRNIQRLTLPVMQALSDEQEKPFMLAIMRLQMMTPEQQMVARKTYRDLLLHKGDIRGDAFALLDALSAEQPEKVLQELHTEHPHLPIDREAAAAQLSNWLAQISNLPEYAWWNILQKHPWTLGCGKKRHELPQVRFSFVCNQVWEGLSTTGEQNKRYCQECGEYVYRCQDQRDMREHAWNGHCIAVPAPLTEQIYREKTRMMVGRPHAPSLWAEEIWGQE